MFASQKKKETEKPENKSEDLCSRGCLWKSCWRLPAISDVWCAVQGSCRGRLHKNSSITKDLRGVWLVMAPWGGNPDVLSETLTCTHIHTHTDAKREN